MLGLVGARWTGAALEPIVTVPVTASSAKMSSVSQPARREQTREGRSPLRDAERYDARRFQPGDDVRHLNWRLFAHTGELFVRIGDELPPPSVAFTVAIDGLAATTAAEADKLCGVACGLATPNATIAVWAADGRWSGVDGGAAARLSLAALLPRGAWVGSVPTIRQPERYLLVTGGDSPRCPVAHRGSDVVVMAVSQEEHNGQVVHIASLR
jgi:hypothetical protein